LAYLASLQPHRFRAGCLLDAAAAIVAPTGENFECRAAYARASYYHLVEMSRTGLDQAAREEGTRMTIDQAIGYALQGGQ
jgi:hypothetical protein